MSANFIIAAAAAAQTPTLPAFMTGCWNRTQGEHWTQECWMKPKAGLMLGSSTEGTGAKLQSWEQLRIEQAADGSITLLASPGGRPTVPFKASQISTDAIEFMNPAHDYPQRIHYELENGRLMAEISLLDGSRATQVRYHREEPGANADFIDSIRSDPVKLVTALLGALGTLVAIFLGLRKAREDSLRRGEVLAWADDCIATIENMIVGAVLFDRPAFEQECRKRMIDSAFDAAALIERGRIFFKNQPFGTFGSEKPPAYRGLRPRILDPLVAGHQIAVRFMEADEEARIKLQLLAEDYLKAFVSLVQKEIGRERTAAAETKQAGAGFQLQKAMDAVEPERIELVKRMKAQTEYRLRPATPETR